MPIVMAFVLGFLLLTSPAGADIYRWVDDSGAVHLDDDIENVPAAQRDAARIFKAKAVPPQSEVSGPTQGAFAGALARELGLQANPSQDPVSVLQIVGIYPSVGWHPGAALSAAVVQEVVTATRTAARAHRLRQPEASAEAAVLRVSSGLGVAGPPPAAPAEPPPPPAEAPPIVIAPNIVVEVPAPPVVVVERHRRAPHPFVSDYSTFAYGVLYAPLPGAPVSGPIPERIPPLSNPAGRLHGSPVTPLSSRPFTRPVDF